MGLQLLTLCADDPPLELSFRFQAGPPQRYLQQHCDWVLQAELSGGGALLNLGVHLIDLILALTGSGSADVTAIHCQLSQAMHGCAVEDQAVVMIQLSGGATATVSSGYCFPDSPLKRDFQATVVTRRHYIHTTASGLMIHSQTQGIPARTLPCNLDTDSYYGDFIQSVMQDVRSSPWPEPRAGLPQMQAAFATVAAAYDAARQVKKSSKNKKDDDIIN